MSARRAAVSFWNYGCVSTNPNVSNTNLKASISSRIAKISAQNICSQISAQKFHILKSMPNRVIGLYQNI